MESNSITLHDLKNETIKLGKTSSEMTLDEVFAERKGSYLNGFTLFVAHFNSIPNFIHEINIDCKKENKWFLEHYKGEITDWYFDKRYFNICKNAEYYDIFYILYDDLIVNFDTNQSVVRFLFRKTDTSKVEIVIAAIKKFRERKGKHKPEISLLANTSLGIDTKSLLITKPTVRASMGLAQGPLVLASTKGMSKGISSLSFMRFLSAGQVLV